MSCAKEARKRCKTITFWVTPEQAAEIDRMVAASGLTKQDYLARRALEQQVAVVPSSRVMMSLRGEARRIAERLEAIASADGVDGFLLGELRWLSGLMAAFARYGQEDFDAVERIVELTREA